MPGPAAHQPGPGDSQALGESLGPALARACRGRLGAIEWFRSAHARGGAATGFSTWHGEDGSTRPVLVKLPVGPVEHAWTTRLGLIAPERWDDADSLALPTPRVLAGGTSLDGYDLAWLVVERLHGPTLGAHPSAQDMADLVRAAGEFQARATAAAPVTGAPPRAWNWKALVERGRDTVRANGLPEAQRWNEALRHLHRALPKLEARWANRPIDAWCHGDLHPANAMRRRAAEGGEPGACVLIDLALVHPGCWVEDALYLERQHWGHEDRLCGVRPLQALAKFRREHGLHNDERYPLLADTRRALMAGCAPALADREGDAKYLHAALEVLERVLPSVAR